MVGALAEGGIRIMYDARGLGNLTAMDQRLRRLDNSNFMHVFIKQSSK